MKTATEQAAVPNIDQFLARAKQIPCARSLERYTKRTTTMAAFIRRVGTLSRVYESRASFLSDLSQALESTHERRDRPKRKALKALRDIFQGWGNDLTGEFNQDLAVICDFIAGDLIILEDGDVVSPEEAVARKPIAGSKSSDTACVSFPETLKGAAPIVEAPPEFSADRALSEANKIITLLQNDGIEIDWSRDPINEREAKLRTAIISRVEIERRKTSFAPYWIALDLRNLAKCSRGRMGRDIREAIEKWERFGDDERETAQRKKAQRLLDLARRDVAEGFQEDAESEDDDYEDEDDNDEEYEEA